MKIAKTRFLLVLGLCFGLGLLLAKQNKENLIKRKESLEKEILLTNELLKKAQSDRKQNVAKLRLLNAKIQSRNELILVLNDEIEVISTEIKKSEDIVKSLRKDLVREKKFYADLIYSSYKNNGPYQNTIYLFASSDLNQFYLRMRQLNTLRKVRLKKIDLIRSIEITINEKIELLEGDKLSRVSRVNALLEEESLLKKEKDRRGNLVDELNKEEKNLKKQLREKEKLRKEIEKNIERIINEELEKNKFAALTPEQKLVSEDFQKNKGRLPWPTHQGIITEKFGENPHPVLRGIVVRNNGIDITSVVDCEVRSIFGGIVTRVFTIKGAKYTVIIRHGEYYSVYHNLESVTVNPGDRIQVKEKIGNAANIENMQNSSLHLEVWKGLEKLNPEDWISN